MQDAVFQCGLDYCPYYEWCEGDEALFGSYDEWLERPVKPVSQALSMTRMSDIASDAISYICEDIEPDFYNDVFVDYLGFGKNEAAAFGLRDVLDIGNDLEENHPTLDNVIASCSVSNVNLTSRKEAPDRDER